MTHESDLRQYQAEKENLTIEVMKLKESQDIVQQQCFAMATISQSYEQEIALLKQQLLEFQSQTDDRVIIGVCGGELCCATCSDLPMQCVVAHTSQRADTSFAPCTNTLITEFVNTSLFH